MTGGTMRLRRKVHSIFPAAALAAILLLRVLSPCPAAPEPGASSAEKPSYTIYHLKRGEGLSDVAKKYGVPLGEIIRLNRSRLPDPSNPDRVFAGMAVRVPVREEKAKEPAEKVKTPSEAPATTTPAPPGAPATTRPAPPAETPPSAGLPPSPAPSPAPPAAPEKPAAPPPAPEPVPEERIFPETKTLETISPEARRLAEAAAREQAGIRGVWVYVVLAALVVLLGSGLWMLVVFRRALRDISGGASALRGAGRDGGALTLVATRDLGHNSRLFWFKAGERDVFVSTGAGTQVLLPDGEHRQQEEAGAAAEEARPAVSRVSAGRRPRKAPPSASSPAEGEGDTTEPAAS